MEPLTKIAELLIKLLEGRKLRKDRHFEKVTAELYKMAKETFDNFNNVFLEAKSNIEIGKSVREICDEALRARQTGRSQRDHMRTILESLDFSEFTQFEFAIYDLLRGGMDHRLLGYINGIRACDSYIQRATNDPQKHQREIEFKRNAQLQATQHAIDHLQESWEAINASYKVHLRTYLDRLKWLRFLRHVCKQ